MSVSIPSGDGWITDTGASTRFRLHPLQRQRRAPRSRPARWAPPSCGSPASSRAGGTAMCATARSVEELAGDPNPTCGFFNGYLYVNAPVVRVFGERSGGSDAIDAAFFGNRPDTPPHVAHPDDLSEQAAARIGDQMGWVMSATEFPELDRSKAEADAARADRPDLLPERRRARRPRPELRARGPALLRRPRDHQLNTAVGPTVLAQVTGAIDPGLMLRMIASSGDVDSALPSYAMWHLLGGQRPPRSRRRSMPESAACSTACGRETPRPPHGWPTRVFLVDYGSRAQRVGPVLRQLGDAPRAGAGSRRPHAGRCRRGQPLLRHERATADWTRPRPRPWPGCDDEDAAVSAGRAGLGPATGSVARSKTNCIKVINEIRRRCWFWAPRPRHRPASSSPSRCSC